MTVGHDTAMPSGDSPNGCRRRLHRNTSGAITSGRISEMGDQHARGTVSRIKGTLEEVAGKVTGNKGQQLHGKAGQIQGSGQRALGAVQDAVRKPDAKSGQA